MCVVSHADNRTTAEIHICSCEFTGPRCSLDICRPTVDYVIEKFLSGYAVDHFLVDASVKRLTRGTTFTSYMMNHVSFPAQKVFRFF